MQELDNGLAEWSAARGWSDRAVEAVICQTGELGCADDRTATEDVANPDDLEIGGQLRKRFDMAPPSAV